MNDKTTMVTSLTNISQAGTKLLSRLAKKCLNASILKPGLLSSKISQ